MKQQIQNILYKMKIGEEIVISCSVFEESFQCGWPSIYRTHEEAFLSSMIGSGCGMWRVRCNGFSMDRIISRHEESDKRYYVDPDRAHLFKIGPDGTLIKKEI